MADELRYLEEILLALRENDDLVRMEGINACHENVHLLSDERHRDSKIVKDLVMQLLLIANAEPRKYICDGIIDILVTVSNCLCEDHYEELSKLMLRSGITNSIRLARLTKKLLQRRIQNPKLVVAILQSSYLNIIYGAMTPKLIREYLNLFQVQGVVGLKELKSSIREEHLFFEMVLLHRNKSVRDSFEPKNSLNAQILNRRWSQRVFYKENIFHFRNESLELLKLGGDISKLWRSKCIIFMQNRNSMKDENALFSYYDRLTQTENEFQILSKFCIYD